MMFKNVKRVFSETIDNLQRRHGSNPFNRSRRQIFNDVFFFRRQIFFIGSNNELTSVFFMKGIVPGQGHFFAFRAKRESANRGNQTRIFIGNLKYRIVIAVIVIDDVFYRTVDCRWCFHGTLLLYLFFNQRQRRSKSSFKSQISHFTPRSSLPI